MGAPCLIHVTENVRELHETDEDGTDRVSYAADSYAIETPYREDILDVVADTKAIWVRAAKEKEMELKNKTLTERVTDLETMTGDLALAILGA